MAEKFDVIVVGAGPSGMAAAYLLAKAGLNTIVIERGDYPGSKNVMGGVLYRYPTEEIIPGFWKEAPLERPVVEQRMWLLEQDSVVSLGYKSKVLGQEPYNSFTVLRAKFDRWFAQQGVEAGALLITETVVEDVLVEKGRVIGVRTGRDEGEVLADVVILAEGVNSILTQKLGLQKDGLSTREVAVAVKEIIALPKEKIEDRFNLEPGEGATIELYGAATQGMVGSGFIYTNKDSLSVGVGALLVDVVKKKITPNELLEQMKRHPAVRPLLEGGEIKEYMGHLIPEGGYRSIPRLYMDGLLVVGDAAMLVNGIHREGSNMAMMSGKFAAETVIEAKEKGDFSAQFFSRYQKKLADSFILKDLKKYENASLFFENNPHLFTLYPRFLNYIAHELTIVDNMPKKEKQRKIWQHITEQRGKWQIIRDLYRGWRVLG
ncbi:FAD-dependent oxidoreductase [Calderihabitans maritimus]|uniref:Dehydrogenases n=1 Tax=Calderihabitans maritimus TaxID=1246530 RepID=A0A1Z5HQ34_9FIRM|nr:FAD-dependent oxidoreductase [Calderihabitans maritimus]GAW91642.1 dehydrogenases [Calderihabitans maritimus]